MNVTDKVHWKCTADMMKMINIFLTVILICLSTSLKSPNLGVAAQNQADSYKRMVNGDWVFGVEHAWVLAPTRSV